jgi:hypothetical protein
VMGAATDRGDGVGKSEKDGIDAYWFNISLTSCVRCFLEGDEKSAREPSIRSS